MKTAETEHGHRLAGLLPPDRAAELAPRLFWSAPVPFRPDADLAPLKAAVRAEVNHGRWVVSCQDCNGAQLASREDPRFMCVECGNASIGGKWRRVLWPAAVYQIEAALQPRFEQHQHWTPGETVADLLKENEEMISKVGD